MDATVSDSVTEAPTQAHSSNFPSHCFFFLTCIVWVISRPCRWEIFTHRWFYFTPLWLKAALSEQEKLLTCMSTPGRFTKRYCFRTEQVMRSVHSQMCSGAFLQGLRWYKWSLLVIDESEMENTKEVSILRLEGSSMNRHEQRTLTYDIHELFGKVAVVIFLFVHTMSFFVHFLLSVLRF